MKKACFVILLFPFSLFAQSPAIMPPGTGETSPSSACMGCQGTIWNNEPNVSANDAQIASISLNPNGFCFQSTCYFSRYLYAHNFSFAIPGTATIDSILVDVKRVTVSANAIKDSIVQLYDGTTNVGNNLQSQTPWSTSLTTYTYGHTDPLWGAIWTPAILNNQAMGLMLKIKNLQASQQNAGVDFVQMTVYYSTATGNFSVSSSPSEVNWITNDNSVDAEINSDIPSVCSSSLFDVQGQLIEEENYGTLNAGENRFDLSTIYLQAGIYFWKITVGNQTYTRKIVITSK